MLSVVESEPSGIDITGPFTGERPAEADREQLRKLGAIFVRWLDLSGVDIAEFSTDETTWCVGIYLLEENPDVIAQFEPYFDAVQNSCPIEQAEERWADIVIAERADAYQEPLFPFTID